MNTRTRTVGLATLAGVLFVSATGIAVASGTTSTVTTCANGKTGVLRVEKKCGKGEKTYKLGVVGPTGKTGAAGTPGSPGSPGLNGTPGLAGTRGPSDVYVDRASLGGYVNSYTSPNLSLALPAGSYEVSARVTAAIFNPSSTATLTDYDFYCYLATPGGTPNFSQDADTIITAPPATTGPGAEPGEGFASSQPEGVLILAAPQTLSVSCSSDGAKTGSGQTTYSYGTILATAVGAVHADAGSTAPGFHGVGPKQP